MARPSLIRPTMKAPPIYTIPATGVRRGARTEGRPSRMRAHGHLPLRHARALRRVRGSATRRCGRRRQPRVPTTVRVTSRVVRRGRSIVEGWRPAAHRHLPFALRPRVAAKNFDALWQLATALTIGTHTLGNLAPRSGPRGQLVDRFASALGRLRRRATMCRSSANAPQRAGARRRKVAMDKPVREGASVSNPVLWPTRSRTSRRGWMSISRPHTAASVALTMRRSSANAPQRAGARLRSATQRPRRRTRPGARTLVCTLRLHPHHDAPLIGERDARARRDGRWR
jgi:hypothetical protein